MIRTKNTAYYKVSNCCRSLCITAVIVKIQSVWLFGISIQSLFYKHKGIFLEVAKFEARGETCVGAIN